MRTRDHHETTFVGRSSTMHELERWRSDAIAGSPRLGIVIGEPGIGKSRVIDEWLQRSVSNTHRVLIGACHEHVDIPFLPLATALEQIPAAAEYLYPDEHAASAANWELRRFIGAARSVLEAAAHRPTVLVLEDVHWSDPATLQFVDHLTSLAARTALTEPVRLVVILTTRPHEGSPEVQAIVRRLMRQSEARVAHLQGLNELELNELLGDVLAARPSRQLVGSIAEATRGNPLLVRLLVDRLAAEDQLIVTGDRVVSRRDPEHFLVASDMEAAWQQRLDQLQPSDRMLLELAALLGDESSIDDLQAVAGADDTVLDGFLERSEHAGLLAEIDARYRFAHPHLRSALVAGLPGRRRARLEAQIASRLWLRYRDHGGTRLLEILHHLRRAGPNATLEDLDALRLAAATEASRRGMWAQAATCYEDALGSLPPTADRARRAELQLRAGQAHHRNQDFARAVPHHLAAIDLARASGDLRTWGEALFWLAGADVLERADSAYYDDALVTEFLAAAADEVPDERALLLAYRAQHEFGRFDASAGLTAITEARRLAHDSPRSDVRHFVAHIEGVNRLGTLELAASESSFAEALALSDDHADPWLAVWAHVGMPLVRLARGELQTAEIDAAVAVEAASDNFQWNLHGLALALRAGAALGQGRVADARHHARLGVQSYHRSDFFYAGAIAYPHLAACYAYVGDVTRAREVLAAWERQRDSTARAHRLLVEAICATDAGDVAAAYRSYGTLTLPAEPSLFSVNPALVAVEVGCRIGDRDLVEGAFDHLCLVVDRGVGFGVEWAMSAHRALAQAAIATDRHDKAVTLLDDALAAAQRAASPLEAARVRLLRAKLGLATGAAHSSIVSDLHSALAYFEQNEMRPFAEEARRVMPDVALNTLRDVVIVYTDLVESTRLNVSMGDASYVRLLREHNRVVHDRLRAFGGVQFAHTGDGVGAYFSSVDAAVDFSIGLQRRFDELNEQDPEHPLNVRIGLARGDVIHLRNEPGELFGVTVVRAVRTCSHAETAQVLVGADVLPGLDPATTEARLAGHFSLKGLAESQPLYEVTRPNPVSTSRRA